MLIGLNGRLKSGKDTTFEIIKTHCPGAERVSFAEPLKESAAQALGISRDTLETLKAHEEIHMEFPSGMVMSSTLPSAVKADLSHWKMNMRVFLQRYGTEAHREVFGDSFWVDQALPLDLDHSDRLIVVTDMRFPNEAQRVLDLGGHTVKVNRDASTAHGSHPSEQDIDHMIEYQLDNTRDLEYLDGQVVRMLLHYGVPTTLGVAAVC